MTLGGGGLANLSLFDDEGSVLALKQLLPFLFPLR